MSGPTGRLRRSERLRISRDFQRVARQGTRVTCRELVLIVAPSFQARPARADAATSPTAAGPMQEAGKARRLGVTASRKVGNAVVRNRLKRRIREWFRHHRAALPEGVDVVVIARPGAGQLAAADLQARLEDLAGRVRT